MRKADLMSVFARKHPAPNEVIFLIASSIVAECSLRMPSLTEEPSRKDK